MELYADIVLPLAGRVYTFLVGKALRENVEVGRCVRVQLGRSKYYMGIVWKLHDERPAFDVIKSIDSFVPNAPVLSVMQMRFWEWLAEYYMCSLGEVMRAAIPSALKPEGFSGEEFARDTYRLPQTTCVSIDGAVDSPQLLNEAFERLKRAPKQYAALIEFVDAAGEDLFGARLPRQMLAADSAALKALAGKKIFKLTTQTSSGGDLSPLPMLPVLSAQQQEALEELRHGFEGRDTVLLHGVTGSGKTELYMHLAREQLAEGHNVLMLMPEIAMTTQLIERIKRYFGDRVITYHSRFTERARAESYRRVNLSKGGELILGVRSALFLPVERLGLVIVDEEHDPSYKQDDPAPRYHARDSAILLAKMQGAKTLLGSATPSLESWFNAREGKYGYVRLEQRYGDAVMPLIIASDTLTAVKRGERTVHFNHLLLGHIEQALADNLQVMLFQNRRGFSPYVECGECGWTSSCPNCNVTLTLHKSEGALRCHYCGHTERTVTVCPQCGRTAVEPRGFGTEKIEEELQKIFPLVRIARLDRDTAHSARSFNAIISSFEQGRTDILVGTQMITKGFDFGGVSVVGILNADNLLCYPDFRAGERAFQIMTQVAGRAGRRGTQGIVVIQTSQPSNPVVRHVIDGDYEAMARDQLAERQAFFYPPFCRLISITMRHRDRKLLREAAGMLGGELRKVFGRRLLGPQPPAVDKVRGEYLLTFMLKVERDRSFGKAKKLLGERIDALNRCKPYRYVRVVCNVDPQ